MRCTTMAIAAMAFASNAGAQREEVRVADAAPELRVYEIPTLARGYRLMDGRIHWRAKRALDPARAAELAARLSAR